MRCVVKLFLGIFLVPCFLGACFGHAAGAEPPEGDSSLPGLSGEIVIGATFPLSGRFENYGQSAYYGALTRVRMINNSGGINGKRLVVEWRDNQSNPALAVRDVEEFARDLKVPAVLGPLLSESALASRAVAARYGIVVMSPMSTSDALVRGNKWMFRACFNNSSQVAGLIDFQMRGWGAKSAAVLYDPRFAFSSELARIFKVKFEAQGGVVHGSLPMFDKDGHEEYTSALATLTAGNPDFLFVPVYALEAIEVVQTLRRLGIGVRVCGSDTWDNELVFDASGRRLAGTCVTSSLFEQEFSYRPFSTFYAAMENAGMDTPDAQAACAYDAVTLLAEALKKGETAEDVRQALHAVKRFPLATGRMTILPDGETEKPVLIRVVEIQGDRLVPVFAERFDP